MLLDFGDTVESLGGAYLTAEDVGTSEPDMEMIAERTGHVTGLAEARGGSGDPSPWTALGCEVALQVTAERAFGTPISSGRSVAVVGLGPRRRPARRAVRAEAARELVVADVDQRKRELADRLGARWTDPARRADRRGRPAGPCALGGVLNDETVPAAALPGDRRRRQQPARRPTSLADALAERGILWAPDFVCNAGGIINISRRARARGLLARARRRPRARRRRHAAPDLRRRRGDANATPLAAALELGRRRLAAGEERRAASAA